jgi:hypothetical protein
MQMDLNTSYLLTVADFVGWISQQRGPVEKRRGGSRGGGGVSKRDALRRDDHGQTPARDEVMYVTSVGGPQQPAVKCSMWARARTGTPTTRVGG